MPLERCLPFDDLSVFPPRLCYVSDGKWQATDDTGGDEHASVTAITGHAASNIEETRAVRVCMQMTFRFPIDIRRRAKKNGGQNQPPSGIFSFA
jgi:hypothetical protein